MPIRKFRSVAEMDGPAWHDSGDPRLFGAMRALWDFAARTLQPRFPPGVHKHRSIEEMNARSDAWADANFRRYQGRLFGDGQWHGPGTRGPADLLPTCQVLASSGPSRGAHQAAHTTYNRPDPVATPPPASPPARGSYLPLFRAHRAGGEARSPA